MKQGTATAVPIQNSDNPGSAPSWFALHDANFVDSLRAEAGEEASSRSADPSLCKVLKRCAKRSESETWRERETRSVSGSQYCLLDIALFLERVYRLSDSDEDRAIDAVYDFMDDCLLEEEFSVCDAALESADPKKLPHSVIVSFLIVTQRSKKKVDKGRATFYKLAIEAVSEKHDQDYVQKLLRNYL